ncbi:hypothetical protein MGN70_004817 [Eutypa lata]|uniref:DUF7907 domain-containing protein n=1 Tax=Eutypa lata (strain UCR-EL1) TaxID=1287681 RepID=M7SWD9_EUTLA|nr:hypothetical protein UCREL1_4149 [Eutypa lata UCREL1]KAI1252614.1 hypothetical protein MGN70_004817 [Eutypa lata]
MLNINVLTFGLLGLASAVPLSTRQIPYYPPTSKSLGFQLIVNVTDPSKDLTPPVNGWAFSAIHTGAGFNEAVISENVTASRIFYQNGTAEEIRYREGSVLSDAGTPAYPWGIQVESKDDTAGVEASVSVNVGGGTPAVLLTQFPEPLSYLTGTNPGTYAICPRNVPYYNTVYNVVRWTYDAYNNATGLYEHTVPEDCAEVKLLPQCAELPDLLEWDSSSHDFAATSNCYDDVSAINWAQ